MPTDITAPVDRDSPAARWGPDDAFEFERRWEAMSEVTKAELIDGVIPHGCRPIH